MKSNIKYNKTKLSPETKIALYRAMLKPRLIEEKMLILLRQGRISKWFSGIGQEAISVGVTMSMQPEEYILPMVLLKVVIALFTLVLRSIILLE